MKKCLIVIISFLCAGEMFSQKDSYFPQVFFDKIETTFVILSK